MTPQEFIEKWSAGGPAAGLNEKQGAQPHFMDLCAVLGVPTPGSEPDYLFEKDAPFLGAARGYADVFKRGYFAWENKAPGRDLDAALRQLLNYSLSLSNPPLLVVCDRLRIRIHTQFNGHPSQTHEILLQELDQPPKRELLRQVWLNPEHFRPRTTTRDITETAAKSFADLAERLRSRHEPPEKVAHFLTQCLFCFFAEDVGLLPGRMFERLVQNRQLDGTRVSAGLAQLFLTMRDGGLYGPDEIPWFNGGLFRAVDVPALQTSDVAQLRVAASLNWSAIDVSIFGTLFERGLDPDKRSQLGAHYTDPETIMRLIRPVLDTPLARIWDGNAARMRQLLKKSTKKGDKAYRDARTVFIAWLEQLRQLRVLDPACGSGNFLFLALKTLKDLEYRSHVEASDAGLDRETDLVTGPQNLLGIELNEYAAELARVTIWIGELQWRIEHGYPFKTNPVLEPLDNIECRDALLTEGAEEAAWPLASVIVGNPPFLGDKKMRSELGPEYVDTLRAVYKGRVPGGADLVTYWFEKARAEIEGKRLHAAGLVSTNSIRGGRSREVLDRIAQSSRIFEAWSDLPWVNEGAAVRVSLVAFGNSAQSPVLDGQPVPIIASDLTGHPAGVGGSNLTTAVPLAQNADTSYSGIQKTGPFEIEGDVARKWLRLPNPGGRRNAEVVKPWFNGLDIVRRPRDMWIVDFGTDMTLEQASLYDAPFAHVEEHVKPTRVGKREARTNEMYWIFQWSRPVMRAAIRPLDRMIVTPEVAKHRVFVWLPTSVVADKNLVVIARQDDATLGVLQSRFHILWSLRLGTSLEDRPRYTPTSCFETFPFPEGLSPRETASHATDTTQRGARIPKGDPRLQARITAVADAAHHLQALRESWLNPPEWTTRQPEVTPLGYSSSPFPERFLPKPEYATELKSRTLTNLYNESPQWLRKAHEQLDAAVAAAYGWSEYTAKMTDDEVLARLLSLNVGRVSRFGINRPPVFGTFRPLGRAAESPPEAG